MRGRSVGHVDDKVKVGLCHTFHQLHQTQASILATMKENNRVTTEENNRVTTEENNRVTTEENNRVTTEENNRVTTE